MTENTLPPVYAANYDHIGIILWDLPVPPSVDGLSLVPRLLDPAAPFHRYSFGNYTTHYACSDGRYKLQWQGDSGQEYLFDTLEDPHELHDLADQPEQGSLAVEMRRVLAAWRVEKGDPHVRDGSLKTIPFDWRLHECITFNTWNNRGRQLLEEELRTHR